MPSQIYSTKRYKISINPKKSYIETIFKEGKKKQVGPTTYKNTNP